MSTLSLATSQQTYIVGPHTRPGFNGQGTIDLNDYANIQPLKFDGCTFSHYMFLDLETIDLDSENFANLGIRENFDGPDGDRIDELEVSFTNNGFETHDPPPSIDHVGNVLDGRGRFTGAMNNKERYIPVAVYNRTDFSASNTVVNGIKANLGGRPRHTATYRDIVNGGVHLIHKGELEPKTPAILDWLNKNLELWRYFKQSNITKMAKSIIDEGTRDDSLIIRKKPNAWHSWIKRNLSLDHKKNDYVLVNASTTSGDTYIQRIWCNTILPAILNGTDPVEIIFYTSQYRPEEARKAIKSSIKELESLYHNSFQLAKVQLKRSGLDIDGILASTNTVLVKTKPYTIKGALPQIVKDHDIKSGKLVSVTKY